MVNLDKKYPFDVVMVGCGIANIMCALKIIENKPDAKILMIERGNKLEKRGCPKSVTNNECVHCQPCQITSGFAGAGCFSDTKLTYSPEVGGTLIDYVGESEFTRLINESDELFTKYGGKNDSFFNDDFANKFSYDCQKYGMRLIKSKTRHLGTDGSYSVMMNIYSKLLSYNNVHILCNTDVVDIDFNKHKITCVKNSDEAYFYYKYLSVGVGRYGADWLREICIKNGIQTINDAVDVGVRVEVPNSVTDFVTNNLYEFKIINYSSSDTKVRTFCVNPSGFVTQENYDNLSCVNGHSFKDKKSENTNFALLVTTKFTEPFNEPIKYAKRISELANMLTGGKPMVQRLVDLKNHKRSTYERMSRLSITPTLKNAIPGDIRYALPSNISEPIVETLDNLANVMPNINGKNTILYAPEVKFYSSKVDVTNELESKLYKDTYFIGDGAGITRGIMQAASSGLYVAENILKKL